MSYNLPSHHIYTDVEDTQIVFFYANSPFGDHFVVAELIQGQWKGVYSSGISSDIAEQMKAATPEEIVTDIEGRLPKINEALQAEYAPPSAEPAPNESYIDTVNRQIFSNFKFITVDGVPQISNS